MSDATKKVRYAVVGGGQISQQAFMPGIVRTNNSELAVLVTGNPAKADKVAKRYGIRAVSYDDYGELLASGTIDAVYVATPNFLHADHTIPALEAGIHVLLEKPMATSLEECERILAAQKVRGAKLMIAYRLHNEPGTIDMVTRARRGDFGELRLFTSVFGMNVSEANSRGHNGYWGGPVPDLGVYSLNAARHLFGDEPTSVHAIGTNTPGRHFNFHDTVAVTLRFPGERVAQFTASYTVVHSENFTLAGSRASIHAAPSFRFGPTAVITYVETTVDGESRTHRFDAVEQFGAQTQYFSDCILHDRHPEADGEEGWMDMRVLAAIERSLRTGETVALEPARRGRRIEPDQALSLPPVPEPGLDEMIGLTPQSG